jgi:hypothetical protein
MLAVLLTKEVRLVQDTESFYMYIYRERRKTLLDFSRTYKLGWDLFNREDPEPFIHERK